MKYQIQKDNQTNTIILVEDVENDLVFGDEDITLVDTFLPYNKKDYRTRVNNLRIFASNLVHKNEKGYMRIC
jgi:hypothetical protein